MKAIEHSTGTERGMRGEERQCIFFLIMDSSKPSILALANRRVLPEIVAALILAR
jgi:hypothetical protein